MIICRFVSDLLKGVGRLAIDTLPPLEFQTIIAMGAVLRMQTTTRVCLLFLGESDIYLLI